MALYTIVAKEEVVRPAAKRSRKTTLARPAYDMEALLAAVPVFSQAAKRAKEEAMVFRDTADDDGGGGGAIFYQDARRRYEFRCGAEGLALLVTLGKRMERVMELNGAELAELDDAERKKMVHEGRKIYGEKPSLRAHKGGGGGHNVTWSDAEYSHVGLRTQYLKLKSFQRFTETLNLAARAAAYDGAVQRCLDTKPLLRMASLGGGPAFELDAIREICYSRRTDDVAFELYSIDLQPAWKPYAEALGCTFVAPFDVSKETAETLLAACGGKPIDFLVISYLLIYCSDDRTADLLATFLRKAYATYLLISERTQKQDIVPKLKARGLDVLLLLPQAHGVDQRQMLVTLPARRKPTHPETSPEASLVFPNVPFARGT